MLVYLFCCRQFYFVIKPIERAIKNDIAKEAKPSWAIRDANRRF